MLVRLRILWLGVALALSACVGRLLDRRDPTQRLLERGDHLFEQRADPARLDEAIEVWLSARQPDRPDARLLERLARAYLIRGYAHPEGTADDLLTAREMGLECLRLEPAVDYAITAAGGVLLPATVRSVDAEAGVCMLWSATAWIRWMDRRGSAGAAIDHAVVLAMTERAHALKPAAPAGTTQGALGLALTLRVPPEPAAVARAHDLLVAAGRAAPEQLTWSVELAMRVHAARGDEVAWRQTLTEVSEATIAPGRPESLENKKAQTRAREALGAEMKAPSAWWR